MDSMDYDKVKRNIKNIVKLLPKELNKKAKREILLKAGLISLLLKRDIWVENNFDRSISLDSIVSCLSKKRISLEYEEESASLSYEFYGSLIKYLDFID